jgi:NADH:ubiquinone oxidoreductase subunit
MTITTRLYTALFGELVGQDASGNRYFRRKGRAHGASSACDRRRKEKRWVLYKGVAEPSKVPAEWHGWLHYTFDAPPAERPHPHYAWEKPHQPNFTGTPGAYLPPGHLARRSEHSPTTADYEPWRP